MMAALSQNVAQSLETARLDLAEAEAAHAEALSRVEVIKSRIKDAEKLRDIIRQRRLSGEVSDGETAELAALRDDLEALTGLLKTAESEAAGLAPDGTKLAAAESQWRKHQQGIVVAELQNRATQLETLFTGCLAELASQAQAAGYQNFRDIWQPTQGLQIVMLHSRIQSIAALRTSMRTT